VITVHLLTPDGLSLLAVNSATALMLGMSMPLAIEVIPFLTLRHRWQALIVMVILWAGALAWASSLGDGHALIARRLVNAIAVIYVAGLLATANRRRTRKASR
jgi:hypothetical protein